MHTRVQIPSLQINKRLHSDSALISCHTLNLCGNLFVQELDNTKIYNDCNNTVKSPSIKWGGYVRVDSHPIRSALYPEGRGRQRITSHERLHKCDRSDTRWDMMTQGRYEVYLKALTMWRLDHHLLYLNSVTIDAIGLYGQLHGRNDVFLPLL